MGHLVPNPSSSAAACHLELDPLITTCTSLPIRVILQHIVEVIELNSATENGRGTYVMKLFAEPIADEQHNQRKDDQSNDNDNEKGELLTEERRVRMVDERAPRVGFEPTTNRLTEDK